ncbi:MAG: cytochrome P450 [Gammaproteobacteria bacterium]|jgi:cytochrome P450|nr:cytochrome P450 [Gammaproteobacteria bacterium]MBT5334350.1 cytochrome P450 [Gammaproteobacteria bacterium]MBT5681681.1 cytochrome P450 [Gammaproteobacteria bacterium]MBT6025861.1 cytochrome P450 [Gammaproteobacteria bacterium]MBT6558964.1 cytochrome P450 [Gammaproteobacteria bacterium]
MSESLETMNPYEGFKLLREHAPVSQLEADGPWQVARHADVNAILRDHATFSSDVSMQPEEKRGAPSMLFSDPPVHHRLRRLVSVAFKPSQIQLQEEQIRLRCNDLLDAIPVNTEVDLVTALAAPLPVMVIAEMLGVEDGDMATFKAWSDEIFSNIGEILFGTPSPESERAAEEMNAYFLQRINDLREHPKNHLLGQLVATETEDGVLDDEELLSFCRLLLIAGNETTTGLITASARIFHENPNTLVELKQKPELAATFVEEALRFYSPFSATVRRTTKDVEIAGQKIAAGQLVVPLIASANRDEQVFTDPDKFKLDRDTNPHLAMGYGIHFCLGAHLARLEGKIVAEELARRYSNVTLTSPKTATVGDLGGPKELAVVLS